jgi:hypothetical protein
MFGGGQIPQLPLSVPGNPDQVPKTRAEPIPNPVLGLPGGPGPMVDGHFQDQGSGIMGQDWHEAVEAVEREELLQDLALEGAYIATGVAKIHPEGCFPCPSGYGSREPAHSVVHPFGPHAADQVISSQFVYHPWKVGRVILKVTVECGDNRSSAGTEACPKGRALPVVL